MKIKLCSLNYSEYLDNPDKNPWQLNNLLFGEANIVVGKNATGKTRTISVLNNLANIIALRSPLLNGYWNAEFKIEIDNKENTITYELEIKDGKVKKELIKLDHSIKLNRNGETKIYSAVSKTDLRIDPPSDKLVLHIRRDKTEYPFFEYLIEWASNTHGFRFGNTTGELIEIPNSKNNLMSLNTVPTIFDSLSLDSIKKVIIDFNLIGYRIENARTSLLQGAPVSVKILQIKEKDLKQFIDQPNLSQGMFRAFSLLVLIQHMIDTNSASTILVDDLCEGLDYERSTKFTQLVFDKAKNEKFQFIATTNDNFIMNTISIEHWNILHRQGGKVQAYNYKNSKEIFDEFKLTGLTNFDIFSSDYLSKLTKSN